MALRAYYGMALLAVLAAIALVYVRLTILKIDLQPDLSLTERTQTLSKGIESFEASHARHLNDHQNEAIGIQLK
ncbi:MAG TPA: hypothetical protein VEU96_08030, partial [Bryobacteraceae bacterium]|nr:hypothetical protein [Bryobacteraceae bacterium]